MRVNAALLVMLMTVPVAQASDVETLQVDRYTSIELGPTANELDPLSVAVSIQFPPTVITVKDAIHHVLRNTGWTFVSFPEDKALNLTLERRLPLVHRKTGIMSIRDLLNVLVGQAYTPIEDPIRRLYSFDLKDKYKGLVSNER